MPQSTSAPAPYRPLRDTSGPAQITGDAVILDVPAAGIALRILSGLIDLVARFVAFGVVLYTASKILGDGVSEAVAAGVTVLVMASAFVLVPALIETLTYGRSLGKIIVGLRVVRTDGGAVSFRHALVRAFIGYVENLLTLGTVAFLTAMVTVRSRRLGDLAAGTYVVREVRRLRLPPPAAMPYALAPWANGATVAPLPAPLANALTAASRGAAGINPQVYRAQVDGVLRAVLPYVSPPPPPGHDPVAVLNAIAVLRRDADARLLAREDAVRQRLLH